MATKKKSNKKSNGAAANKNTLTQNTQNKGTQDKSKSTQNKQTINKSTQNKNASKKSKSSSGLLIAAAAVILCAAVGVTFASRQKKDVAADNTANVSAANVSDANVSGTNSSDANTSGANASGSENTDSSGVQVISPGENLVIPVSEVSSTASFYTVEVDGTQMEVLAVRDSQGTIRTAFNTCQICYSSGRGYYVQDGDVLVCQNCGNRFTVDQVEIESGGCNPWPIFPENKTVTDEAIEISYDFLNESKSIFERWKTQY